MNILEAFHFIFEADASNLEGGLKRADRLNTDFQDNISETDEKAKMLGSAFLDLTKAAVGFFAGLATISGIKTMSDQIAEEIVALDTQATALNVNAGELYTWQNAVKAAGGTAEGFNSTLANLNKVTRDPERTLLRLSDSFRKMSSYRAQKVGEMMGIDAGTAELLRSGREGVQAMLDKQREYGVITAEQIEVSKKYRDALRDTERVYDDIRRRIAIAVLPIMTQWLDLIQGTIKFLQDHKVFAISFFAGVAGIITAMYLPAMLRAVAATYALLAPYILVGAAVAAVAGIFALAVDDVYNFLEGNDSLIGRLAEKWPWIGDMVRGVYADFKALWELIKELSAILLMAFTDPEAAWERFKQLLVNGMNDLKATFPGVFDFIDDLRQKFETTGKFINNLFDGIGQTIRGAFSALVESWNYLLSYLPDWVQEKLGIKVEAVVNDEGLPPGEMEQKGAALEEVRAQAVRGNGYPGMYDPTPTPQQQDSQNPQPAAPAGDNRPVTAPTPAPTPAPRKMDSAASTTVNNNDNRKTNNQQTINNMQAAASTAPALQPGERKSRQQFRVTERESAPAVVAPDAVARQQGGEFNKMVAGAQAGVATMAQNPVNTLTTNVMNNANRTAGNRTTEINIDNIEVNTQASDADGIAKAIDGSMKEQFQNATNQYEDGYSA